MKIGILKETAAGERRVALVPETVKRLSQKKFEILVQTGAGEAASFSDAEYLEAGAVAVSEAEAVAQSDIICRINKPSSADAGRMHSGTVHISLLYPLLNPDLVKVLASSGVTAVSLDSIPRTTLAQMMDVLSSQATVAGYWAVLAAANRLPKFFPMLMTAAGTVSPAKVLVLGAGVAGLQAIGTARRLGAVVEAFDVRKASKTEVESLGAKFVTVSEEDLAGEGGYAREASQEYKKRQADLIGRRLAKADVAITTALIPGRQAPILITEDMARAMRPGSVIVDLAAEQGGNCELTEPGKEIVSHGITVIGLLNIPSALAVHASQMFSRNLEKLLLHLSKDGRLNFDFKDEIVKGCVITHEGKVVHAKAQQALSPTLEAEGK